MKNFIILFLILMLTGCSTTITKILYLAEPYSESNSIINLYGTHFYLEEDILKPYLTPNNDMLPNNNTIKTAGFHYAGTQIWPNEIILYQLDVAFKSLPNEVAKIEQVMRAWELNTPITFQPANPLYVTSPTDTIYFINHYSFEEYEHKFGGSEGNSTLGYGTKVGFNYKAPSSLYTIAHELGHCLGLHHEHQRPDRDIYINNKGITNLEPSWDEPFEPHVDHKTTEYDYVSVMHYQNYTRNDTNERITPSELPTVLDRQLITTLYKTEDQTSNLISRRGADGKLYHFSEDKWCAYVNNKLVATVHDIDTVYFHEEWYQLNDGNWYLNWFGYWWFWKNSKWNFKY